MVRVFDCILYIFYFILFSDFGVGHVGRWQGVINTSFALPFDKADCQGRIRTTPRGYGQFHSMNSELPLR